ncbi:MAG: hypothetical protein EXS76_01910 [Nitrosarchaeum sp.]|nr:hypothetical protein [Nitrosarchaeum sp.]
MSNTFGMFLLFSMLVTGLIVNPLAFAQETPVNATETTDMTESSNSTSTEDEAMVAEDELETELETEDEMTEAEMIPTVLSPLKQIKAGTVPENVVCKEGLELVFKLNGQPACVKTTSIQKLIAWGWTQ